MHSLVRNCVCFTEVVYSLNCVIMWVIINYMVIIKLLKIKVIWHGRFFFVVNSLPFSWKNYRHAYSFNLQEVFGDDLIDWDMIKIPSFCQILKWNQKLCIWLWWYDRRDSFMKFHEIFKYISWNCYIESIFLSKEN